MAKDYTDKRKEKESREERDKKTVRKEGRKDLAIGVNYGLYFLYISVREFRFLIISIED